MPRSNPALNLAPFSRWTLRDNAIKGARLNFRQERFWNQHNQNKAVYRLIG